MHRSDTFIHHSPIFYYHDVCGSKNAVKSLSPSLFSSLGFAMCFMFQSATHSPADGHSSVTSVLSSVPIAPRLQPHWGWSRRPRWTSKGQHQTKTHPLYHCVLWIDLPSSHLLFALYITLFAPILSQISVKLSCFLSSTHSSLALHCVELLPVLFTVPWAISSPQ